MNKKSKKGLLMTVLVLVLFMLMLAELLSFVVLNINYDSIDKALSLSTSSMNYGKVLTMGATNFAPASLSRAISTLASYEYNSSLRRSNFITNTTLYISDLIVNGTLPNVQQGSLAGNFLLNSMGGLTFSRYNSSIIKTFTTPAISVMINETTPVISQPDPYSISISYLESVAINSTIGRYTYQIPVNATISLNGAPDLLSYEEGVMENIKFTTLSNLTSIVGGVNATNGNTISFVYGPVYTVPSGVSCAALPGSLPSAFIAAPYNTYLIIATNDAEFITGPSCNAANQYGGLITYQVNSLSPLPTVPWLQYPSTSGVLSSIASGQQLLLYGPALSTMNIQNLINAASNGYYFASPFTPSYLDRAQDSLLRQSPNGMFTFSNYNTQTAGFNGANSYIDAGNGADLTLSNAVTISAWVYGNNIAVEQLVISKYPNYHVELYNQKITFQVSSTWKQSNTAINNNAWYHIVASYDGTNVRFYLNGTQDGTQSMSTTMSPTTNHLCIGKMCNPNGYWFSGFITNVQVYNTSLTSAQIQLLYQEGISGLPIPNSGLVAWYSLNGNANDYSGNGNTGVATSVSYSLIPNYVRDSILSTTVPTSLSAIPGVLSCKTMSQCTSSSLPHLYLGYMPLEVQQNTEQTAQFNGASSYIATSNFNNVPTSTMTICGWIKSTLTGVNQYILSVGRSPSTIKNEGMLWINVTNKLSFVDYNAVGYGFSGIPESTVVVADGNWHFVCFVKNSLSGAYYVNGGASGSETAAYNVQYNGLPPLAIGANIRDNNHYFSGAISNIQIYNSSLSAGQVSQLYSEGIYGMPILSANLVAWYPLAGSANDYSGSSNNGISTNVLYPYLTGTYNAPGLSTITGCANEWQAIGLANT